MPAAATPLKTVAKEAASCTLCPLYRNATQTVFGEGAARARIMLVGEQPGDQEDQAGHPFVGPAGKLLDRALEQAGRFVAEDLASRFLLQLESGQLAKPIATPAANNPESR